MSPIAFVNHNSYAILAGAALLIGAWRLLRRSVTWRGIALYLALAAVLVIPPLYVRSGGGRGADALDAALASGKPTLLEVYSPF
ncbi:MAG TPA: hypothetical protein VGR87_15380 [Candidatus Limnocylindria bacterium]|nr:hypothetical protein [Candidatus Limnocylindria bacterium]